MLKAAAIAYLKAVFRHVPIENHNLFVPYGRSLSILPTVRSDLLMVKPHVYIDNCFFDFLHT
jgi:hypothetical protein